MMYVVGEAGGRWARLQVTLQVMMGFFFGRGRE